MLATASECRSGSPWKPGMDGTRKARVANNTSPSCRVRERRSMRASRPNQSAAPRTSKMFDATLPASEPRTTFGRPWLMARIAMISSGALPKVALRNPPIPGPVCSPACSVASPINQASGTSAHAATMNSTTSPAPTTHLRRKTTGASASEAHKRFRATGWPLPRAPVFVKSCAAPPRPSKSVHAGRSRRGAGQAPTPSAGRSRVPEMRRSLRQGGVSGDLRRAQLPLPLRL